MSRIDEALRQAGLRSQTSVPTEEPLANLDSFPLGPEPELMDTPRVSSERTGAVAAPPVRERVQHAVEPAQAAHSARSQPAARDVRSLAAEKLVVHEKTGRACVEQYRRVAAMLHQLQEERGTKVLMVASAQPGEGKTLTAANLALTLSESYRRRVLLIDADLRRPSLNTLFRLQSVSGLSERLKGHSQGPLRVLELSERLALLPGGTPDADPMSGLTSGRMEQIIEQASANYDWIILDTPPVALQPDATLLAGIVEATIFVIGAGKTRSAVIQHAIETIGREKIVGVILNRIDNSELDESAYYHYYGNSESIRAGGTNSRS
ncbi:MAG TPA: CpsD/CapB family tyrosine-protein kinase [Vicinamibacterales bacterium]|nr:CpsD/CapB family tyrosine-protein kinase [Vicinamibacterales bacterium]